MAGNTNLRAANKAKKDEFHTQLTDIEKELRHYRQHFRDKTVLCNRVITVSDGEIVTDTSK